VNSNCRTDELCGSGRSPSKTGIEHFESRDVSANFNKMKSYLKEVLEVSSCHTFHSRRVGRKLPYGSWTEGRNLPVPGGEKVSRMSNA
jgi:hypothetical protein